MTNPYPLPRSIRQTEILVGDGGSTYGPFAGFRIFDVEDVEVWTKPEGAARFSQVDATITKAADLPFDFFTFTVPGSISSTTQYVVRSARLHERTAGVVSGTRIDPTALEKELSKQGSVLQELRRELSSRLVFSDFGTGPQVVLPSPDGVSLLGWSADNKLINRQTEGVSLALAETFANIAQAAANNNLAFTSKFAAEASIIPPAVTSIILKGYFAEKDGGAWPSVIEVTEDNSELLPWQFKTNGGSRRWELQTDLPTDVMFGSLRGVGFEDTSAVQALLDYCELRSSRGKLVKGKRRCGRLFIGSKVELFGEAGAELVLKDGANTELIVNRDGVNGNSDIEIHHIRMDGNRENQAASIDDLIRLNKCTDCEIHHCWLSGGIWAHINISAGVGVHVYRCKIRDGNGHGIVLRTGCVHCEVYRNRIVDIGPANGVDNGAGTTIFAYGILLYDGQCRDNEISHNAIINPNGHGIYAGGFPGDEAYNDNKYLFNRIINAGAKNIVKSHHGIWITNSANSQIIGNTVRGSGVDGIKLNVNSHRNTVTLNNVSGSGRGGLAIDDADYNAVNDNQSWNNGQLTTGNGITVGQFGVREQHNAIARNFCYDTQAIPTQTYGIREQGPGSDYNDIEDNRCYANSATGQILKFGAHTKAHKNKLRSPAGVMLDTITVTGTQTLPVSAQTVLINVTASRTLTLPTAANMPDDYNVLLVDIGGNLATFNVIINAPAGFTINGAASFTMNQNRQHVRIQKIAGESLLVA